MTTINDISDLVQILQERPEWLQIIRGLIIGEELAQVNQHLAALDQKLAEFIEFTKQNAEIVDRRLSALETGFERMEARQDRFEARQEEFEARQQRFEERLGLFDARQESFDARQQRFEERQDRFDVLMTSVLRDLAYLKGSHTRNAAEKNTRRIARTQNCRQVRILNDDELYDLLQENDTSDITPGDQRSFVDADIVIEGEDRNTGETCYIAVEASFTAHEDDVRRAARNAEYLARFTGNPAIPVVAAVHLDDKVQPDFDRGRVHWYPVMQRDIEPD